LLCLLLCITILHALCYDKSYKILRRSVRRGWSGIILANWVKNVLYFITPDVGTAVTD
jgi:hypothetical protein